MHYPTTLINVYILKSNIYAVVDNELIIDKDESVKPSLSLHEKHGLFVIKHLFNGIYFKL